MRLRLGARGAFVVALRIFCRNIDRLIECRGLIERFGLVEGNGFVEQGGFVASIRGEGGVGERAAGRSDVFEEEFAAFLRAFDKAQVGKCGIRCYDRFVERAFLAGGAQPHKGREHNIFAVIGGFCERKQLFVFNVAQLYAVVYFHGFNLFFWKQRLILTPRYLRKACF